MTQDPGIEPVPDTDRNQAPPQPLAPSSGASARGILWQPGRAFPGVCQSILLIVLMTFVQVVLTIPFVILGLYRHPAALALPILVGTMAAVAYGYSRNFTRTGARFKEVFPLVPVRARTFLLLLLAVFGLMVVNLELARLVTRILPPPGFISKLLAETIRTGQPWTVFALVALVAPISEEFLFRGLILHSFLARYGTARAIVISALLFALVHGNPWQFAAGLLSGLFLAWCFVQTRSLIPCLFAHIANNTMAFLLPRIRPKTPALTAWMTNHSGWVDAAGIIALASGIYLLHKYSRPKTTKENAC